MLELMIESAGRPVLRCPLQGVSISVGASAANDISIPGEGVPPWLCSFERQEGGSGYDVVARAGQKVRVDDTPQQRAALKEGTRIELGQLVAKVRETVRPQHGEAPESAQRTGILTRTDDGKLVRTDLRFSMGKGAALEIGAHGLRVGADPSNDIVVNDGFISSFHAQVFIRGERVFVRDLDSTNGTFVDGVRVIEAELVPGADIRFGKTSAKIITEEQAVEDAEVNDDGPWTCCDMVTADRTFAQVFATIRKVASHDATVCVLGETGCGKELVAHALHQLSARVAHPFVPVNCAAIPETLIESVLFGHERGAFTGADKMKRGVFEQADGGTLFLDELGELPLEMQAKLLRALETRSVRRLGGKSDITFDARIVCATHQNLTKYVAEGAFREDLLHRLYVFPIELAPLRERPADIGFLAHHFVQALSERDMMLSAEAEEKLMEHPFPGNVRELRNVIQRALILTDDDKIGPENIKFIPIVPTAGDEGEDDGRILKAGQTLADIERQVMQEALDAFGSVALAAKALGLPKTSFWRRAKALGVSAPSGSRGASKR